MGMGWFVWGRCVGLGIWVWEGGDVMIWGGRDKDCDWNEILCVGGKQMRLIGLVNVWVVV